MVSSVLQSMDFSVGQYSSPHLQDVRERITIDNEWISERAFTGWTERLRRTAKQLPPLPDGYATFFELLTAMAFLHFRRERVDFAVIETGMGGRLDATNVVNNPLVTAMTRISLEHTDTLGDSLEAIADEKLGITRPCVPAIVGHQDTMLIPHFKKRLNMHRAPVVFTDESYQIHGQKLGRRYRTLEIGLGKNSQTTRTVRTPLLGQYQLQNTLTAVAILDTMVQEKTIPPISTSRLNRGLSQVMWPGRFEIIRRPGKPLLILDVAHTARGADALRRSLDEMFPKRDCIFVLGFLKGKNVRDILTRLLRPVDTVILTQAPSPRGMPVDAIQAQIGDTTFEGTERISEPDPAEALRRAERMAAGQTLTIVAGSLYLVGEIRTRLFPSC